ncbi:dynein light chain Tctex-type 5-A-like [Mercenaria mercenaria]|uniref:dynein light chain Tctex-type 5-A-like n=1 Tax=Mercenaria mercenaria TaxID=6596 RepID=UPI001E1D649A|nr:dynein light chain Tctex-type 5-A-like [Mercenaria mercenaria]
MMKRLSLAVAQGGAANTTAASEMGDSTVTESTFSKAVARPSLAGVMLSRKFGKRMSTKPTERRGLGTIGSSSAGMIPEKEPSYRMEPAKKFSSAAAEKVIKEVLDEAFDGLKYNPKQCSKLIKALSDEIKDRVKLLGYDRYKIVCIMALCQRSEQAAVCSSRCILDKANDTYATYTFKNESLICSATVYGIYRE